MAHSHHNILNDDPDLLKLLAFDGNPNQLHEFDDEFISRVTAKISRIDAVNPSGVSRRTAWNVLSRLIAALAKFHAATSSNCYDRALALRETVANTIPVEKRTVKETITNTGTIQGNQMVTETTREVCCTVGSDNESYFWEEPFELIPDEQFENLLATDPNIARREDITLSESSAYTGPPVFPQDYEGSTDGFGDNSDSEFDVDDDSESTVMDTDEPFDVSNDTGIDADSSVHSPSVPLAPADNDVFDACPALAEDDVYDMRHHSLADDSLDVDDVEDAQAVPTVRAPKKRKLIIDKKTQLSSYEMKTRISNPWVDTRPRLSDLPAVSRHKSLKQLLETPSRDDDVTKRRWSSFAKKKARPAETDRDMLNDILGPSASLVFDNGRDNDRVTRSVSQPASDHTAFDVFRFDEASATFDVAAFDDFELPSFDDADVFTGAANRQARVSPPKQAVRFQPPAVYPSAGPASTEAKVVHRLKMLWSQNANPICIKDLLDPASSRFTAAKMFCVLMDLSKKSLVELENDLSGKILNIQPGAKRLD